MADDLNPITRTENIIAGNDLTPITRLERFLAGDDTLTPITRLEHFVKQYAGGGGGNPNKQQTVAGTAANPWGDVSYSELAAALASGDAHAVMYVLMGGTTATSPLLTNDGHVVYSASASIGTTVAASTAAVFSWKVDGSINYIRAISGDQYQDYTAYAAGMQTNLVIYWHPMP